VLSSAIFRLFAFRLRLRSVPCLSSHLPAAHEKMFFYKGLEGKTNFRMLEASSRPNAAQ